MTGSLSAAERKFIQEAKEFLENESVIIRMANAVGKPAGKVQKILPQRTLKLVSQAVEKSLDVALKTSLQTLRDSKSQSWEESIVSSRKNRWLHAGMAVSSGVVGGFFGGPGLIFELPVTTAIMMRNIAAIANQFGFSKDDPQTAMECMYVFTLGSKNKKDDNFDSAYYSSRAAIAAALRQSAQHITASSGKVFMASLRKGMAPIVVNFLGRIAGYFEIVVTEKMLASAIPVVGSVGAAAVNLAFTDYFGQAAQYHFGLLALEKKHGQQVVQDVYTSLSAKPDNL